MGIPPLKLGLLSEFKQPIDGQDPGLSGGIQRAWTTLKSRQHGDQAKQQRPLAPIHCKEGEGSRVLDRPKNIPGTRNTIQR